MFFEVMEKVKKKLFVAVIIDISIALILGKLLNSSALGESNASIFKIIVLPLIYLMLIPPMSNIESKEIVKLKSKKLILATLIINFTVPPALAYAIYCLTGNVHLFIATLLLSLFPTGSMTLNFVHLCHGDEALAMATQIFSLSIGAIMATVLLGVFFSAKISFLSLIEKVALVLAGPFIISRFVRRKVEITGEVKKKMKSLSILGMLSIIFISGFEKSALIFQNTKYFISGMFYILAFYGGVLLTALIYKSIVSKKFGAKEGITAFYTTFLKNITISLGLSALLFPASIIYLVLAYIVQLPTASYLYHRFAKNTKF